MEGHRTARRQRTARYSNWNEPIGFVSMHPCPSNEVPAMVRARMYVGLAAVGLANWVPKNSVASLVPFIVADRGYTESQRAMLLGSFFPGYLATMLPASYLIQRVGAKVYLTFEMAATSVLLVLLPSARTPLALGTGLTCMGLVQGGFIPANKCLQRNWMPQGTERAWAVRIVSLGNNLSDMMASLLSPVLASRLGWESTFRIYGVGVGLYTVLWQGFATEQPCRLLTPGETALRSGNVSVVAPGSGATSRGGSKAPTVEWRIFLTAPVLSCIASRVGFGLLGFALQLWAPTYLQQVMGCTPLQAGTLLVSTTPMMIAGDFGAAAVESILLRRKVSLLNVRKITDLAGTVLQSIAAAGFGLSRTPPGAAASYVCFWAVYGLKRSGYSANLLEIGGPDTAMLNAVTNLLGNLMGFLCPFLVTFSRRRAKGSWLPFWLGCSTFNMLCGLCFAQWASTEEARNLLTTRNHDKK